MKLIAISLLCMLLSTGHAGALTGSWSGELTIGTAKLRLVFNFSEDPTGATLCSIDSPYQGAVGIPATVSLCTADSISVAPKCFDDF